MGRQAALVDVSGSQWGRKNLGGIRTRRGRRQPPPRHGGRGQRDTIQGDRPAEIFIDGLPVQQIDPERQVALGERFPQARDRIDTERPAGVDRQIEVGEGDTVLA